MSHEGEADRSHLVAVPVHRAAAREFESSRSEFERIFNLNSGVFPLSGVALELLPAEQFRAATGAPRFTRALYLNDTIYVALPVESEARLARSIRHELIHAVVARMSARRAPVWFDEGLAQYFEGVPPEEVRTSLPLGRLSEGIDFLGEEDTRRLYAKSLVAVQKLMFRNGLPAVVSYLSALGSGADRESAFLEAFGEPFTRFEERL